MKLDVERIREITTGAVRVEEKKGMVCFFRFTPEQEELYEKTNESFYRKTFSTAGVRLVFRTDSKNLFLKIGTAPSTTRIYFSLDVLVDGNMIGSIDNFSDTSLPRNYTTADLPLGEFSKSFDLGDGIKTVTVHFPWSVVTVLKEMSVDDNAFIQGVRPAKKLLVFGDSITHGYDALHPSNRYIAKLADALEAEEISKAIGGERFFPRLASLKDHVSPDYIIVAYGTNDWRHRTERSFASKCTRFFSALSKKYPRAKIFAVTPIWRKDADEDALCGPFSKADEFIADAVKDLENVTLIHGIDLVPHQTRYFADGKLHPRDSGFDYQYKRLYKEIKKHI